MSDRLSGFNINEFKAQTKVKGFQKNNKFLVRFPLPRGFLNTPNFSKYAEIDKVLEYWCEGATIPGVALSLTPINRYGYGAIEKKPSTPTFTDANFTFIGDGKSDNWLFFQQWIRLIDNYDLRGGINPITGYVNGKPISPFEVSYKYEYASDVNLIVFDDSGTETFNIILRDAYPIYMGQIPLNWADNNTIMKIPITFTFMDWYNASKF